MENRGIEVCKSKRSCHLWYSGTLAFDEAVTSGILVFDFNKHSPISRLDVDCVLHCE